LAIIETTHRNIGGHARSPMTLSQQTVRFVTTQDQVRLAWARCGAPSAPAMVKAANWITHLEYDWESPVWRHWVRFLCEHFQLLRYDERGCGLSQQDVENLDTGNWLPDLEAVVDAARPAEPFVLLGISQGAAASVAYAARHPEKVSHLVLYGGYVRGWALRGNPDHAREYSALVDFAELAWGRPDPLYRRLFTKRFLPAGSEEQLHWFDELCAKTVRPAMAGRLLRSRGLADATDLLGRVRVPTLVVHARGDLVSPISQGQQLAAGIPNAEFVQVDSPNHILLEHEPAWQRFQEAVLDFTGVKSRVESRVFDSLAPREREILSRLVGGLSNTEIGKALFISEKTVRNQLTRIFEKLGVSNRAQAIVFARDHGFQAGE
jgi:pimeloyl-ACP methyl ester carboxylesterase/DNA-binding CsgD family transcriptional regulator